MSTQSPTSPARVIGLVAKREITTRARTKSFLISNAIVLVLILGGIIGASVFSHREDSGPKVGLVGSAASLSGGLSAAAKATDPDHKSKLDISTVADEAAARAKVASGDLDVALVPRGTDGYTAIVEAKVSPELQSVIDSAVRQQAINAALTARAVPPETLAQAVARATVTPDPVKPPDPDNAQRKTIAFVTITLMFFQIFSFGLQVAIGVVEEKSSRVVEVLLATIKPLHLLCGKVMGIGALGLAQLTAYGVVGVGAGLATGLLTVPAMALGVFASVLFWFILGFAFYAMAYAAAGSMVSRQEDINSVATPFTMLIVSSFYLAMFMVQDKAETLGAVMSWIPPFSAMLMPLRIAAGTTNPVEIVGSAVVMLLATTVLALAAARVYERSVLRIGKRVSWNEALRAPS
jgi:ABC-2 type transport system permease protein